MEKIIKIKVSLESSCETKEGKKDITDEVFDSLAEATNTTLADAINSNEFEEGLLDSYGQTLPDNFKGLKDMGFKIEVLD